MTKETLLVIVAKMYLYPLTLAAWKFSYIESYNVSNNDPTGLVCACFSP